MGCGTAWGGHLFCKEEISRVRISGDPPLKNMKVEIRLQESSQTLFYEAENTHTKGPMYCIRLKDNSTLKFPLVNIFSIKEIVPSVE